MRSLLSLKTIRPLTLLVLAILTITFGVLAFATQGGSVIIGPGKTSFSSRTTRPTCAPAVRGMLILAQATTPSAGAGDSLQVCAATTGLSVAWRAVLLSTNSAIAGAAKQKDAPQ